MFCLLGCEMKDQLYRSKGALWVQQVQIPVINFMELGWVPKEELKVNPRGSVTDCISPMGGPCFIGSSYWGMIASRTECNGNG